MYAYLMLIRMILGSNSYGKSPILTIGLFSRFIVCNNVIRARMLLSMKVMWLSCNFKSVSGKLETSGIIVNMLNPR